MRTTNVQRRPNTRTGPVFCPVFHTDPVVSSGVHCLSCQYDLQNLTEHRCPECGRKFDPSDNRSFDSLPRRRRDWIIGVSLLTFAIGGLALQLFFFIDSCAHHGP